MTRFVTESNEESSSSASSQALHVIRKSPTSAAASRCFSHLALPGTKSAFSSKIRFKDERKKVLKVSVRKLKDIDDPEVFLRRSVLINNTTRRLQTEIRAEKVAKRAECGRSYSPSPYSYFSIERIYRDDSERTSQIVTNSEDLCAHRAHPCLQASSDESSSNSSSSSSSSSTSSNSSSSSSDEEEEPMSLSSDETGEDEVQSASAMIKRVKHDDTINVVDNDDDDATSDLLREVYMPPPIHIHPPQMITSLDEEDEPMPSTSTSSPATTPWSNAADWKEEDLWKELANPPQTGGWSPNGWTTTNPSPIHNISHDNVKESPTSSASSLHTSSSSSPNPSSSSPSSSSHSNSNTTTTTMSLSEHSSATTSVWSTLEYSSTNSLILSHNASNASMNSSSTVQPYFHSPSCDVLGASSDQKQQQQQQQQHPYSCGQSSMFGELQSVVFNSLIASLES